MGLKSFASKAQGVVEKIKLHTFGSKVGKSVILCVIV